MRTLLIMAGTCLALHAQATTVSYAVSPLGASQWRYDYVVQQDGASPLSELVLRFDPARFVSLLVLESPPGWDALALQPDGALPDDGIVDLLALGDALAPGEWLAGLEVQVTTLGVAAPGAQPFEVIDPATQRVMLQGTTVPLAAAVPEPAGWALVLLGLGGLSRRVRNAS